MKSATPFPWPSFSIACLTAVFLALAGQPIWLAVVVLLVWGGTLWLATAQPPKPDNSHTQRVSIEDRLGDLIEEAGSPLILSRANRVLIANREARRVLGNHVVGQDMRMALRNPAVLKMLDRGGDGHVLVRGLKRRNDVWRINRKDLGEDMAVVELINRTSEEVISRAHTDFVANASHELRTPLASIIGYVETLREEEAGNDPKLRDKFLGTILKESTRLQSLVSDLMSLSRIEAEKHDAPNTPVGLAEIAERAARDVAGADRIDRLRFEMSERPEIRGDTKQLEQLVSNLVDNAFKYGSQDGPVTVSVSLENQRKAILEVSDTGDGIPAEHIPHLTRRFYRTDPGRSRASGGTGLGLAIVKHIVERHGGRLSIKSEPQQGTSVAVSFPLSA